MTPTAVMFPRCQKGGESLKFILRNPIAVVRLVRNTGVMLTRRLSTIASCLFKPRRISRSIITKIWILSAIASVMIIVGACADGGVRPILNQPATPIAVIVDNRTIIMVVIVPLIERKTRNRMTNITAVGVTAKARN